MGKRDLKRERIKREMEMEQRKEDGRFNNSQTPASFRTESVPKLGVLHMTHHPHWQTHGVFMQELVKDTTYV